MTLSLRERVEVLRDEALDTAEHGQDAPGRLIFDAIVGRLGALGETDPGLHLALGEALERRLAWGDDPTTLVVDCDLVCKRLVAAVQRALPDDSDRVQVTNVVTEVACTASRHIARLAVQRASKERALQRREQMVHRRLEQSLAEQEQRLKRSSQNR